MVNKSFSYLMLITKFIMFLLRRITQFQNTTFGSSRTTRLSAGKYVMVMGVITAVSPEPVIHAVKMADLSELSGVHRRMWKLEVEELQRLLT